MVMTVVVVVDVAVVLVLVVAVLRSGLLRFHQHTSPCAAAATNLAHHGASYAILACCVGAAGLTGDSRCANPFFRVSCSPLLLSSSSFARNNKTFSSASNPAFVVF